MTNPTGSNKKVSVLTEVQRGEFDAFVSATNQSWDRIGETLRQMRADNAREADGLRRELKDLKIVQTRGPDYKAMIAAAALVVGFIFSIGSTLSWGVLQKFDALETEQAMHDDRLDERGAWMGLQEGFVARLIGDVASLEEDAKLIARTRYTRADSTRDLDAMRASVESWGAWIAEHDRTATGLNATQSERIEQLMHREGLRDKHADTLGVRFDRLEETLAERGVILDRLEAEQIRLTNKVYNAPGE